MRGLAALSFAATAVAAVVPAFGTETIHNGAAPLLSSVNAEVIPDRYIIKFKSHVTDKHANDHHVWLSSVHSANQEAHELELRKRGQWPLEDGFTTFEGLKHKYSIGSSFAGYAGHWSEDTIEAIRSHPDVEAVEHDTIVHTMEYKVEESCNGETEKMAPWGLARVSHRNTLSFGTFNKYLYAEDGGEGVDAYVIDTGTNIDHVDFEGRASWGKTIPKGDADADGNGHGTHCSGTIAGKKYGVAKKANVYAVKVLRSNGSGTMADVIGGVDWAASNHLEQVNAAKDGKRKGFKGSVANMSLGGGKTKMLDAAVNAAVEQGIHFAVAAGNDNADACNYSPAAAENAVTVGASAIDDSRAYFSNYGKCTDIFAPGLSIQSTWIGSDHAVNTISGTSMASPHIAGLLAYFLSLQPAKDSEYSLAAITPKELKSQMISLGTSGALSDLPSDTPNVLAWNGGGCSNYSAILEAGGYAVQPKSTSILSSVSDKVAEAGESLADKVDKLSEKIHELVDEELKEFMDEMTM
ncbi:hypothetical protein M406DRAFT_102797 [Cryphonectria parasitica EP155]|uniref:Uncharacterized protein n=1 Tax=Cryphonectria parasitica (strain ATCC 38755 / EP155) TaxID=660469 RepID=A0A9P5CTR8_CRYP1|nr:uncharacterized protein M406DRAFT_102797 [Cryphonectria parasitica EP155]KAF3769400.1 hypothetical protein M406DRAFT_102797 [Cryphonectria parasitica EP155]